MPVSKKNEENFKTNSMTEEDEQAALLLQLQNRLSDEQSKLREEIEQAETVFHNVYQQLDLVQYNERLFELDNDRVVKSAQTLGRNFHNFHSFCRPRQIRKSLQRTLHERRIYKATCGGSKNSSRMRSTSI